MTRTLLSMFVLTALAAAQPMAQSARPKAEVQTAKPSLVVNLNTASATDLQELPGIGAKVAARIVDYRQKKGPFKKVEDILESSRSCPYLLMISRLSAHRTVARNR